MKQTRRKELKTNELSVFLHESQEWIQRNANYLLIGLAAVVLILVIALYAQHNRSAAMQAGWNQYNDIRHANVLIQPEKLDQAANLASEYGSSADLGPLALQLQGDLAYQVAMSLFDAKDRARRLALLKTAQQAFNQELDRFKDRQDIRARALMSLAAVEEDLVVAGEGSAQAARQDYQRVIDDVVDGRPAVWQALAKDKLNTLDERLQKLQIVATQPASAPA